MHSDVGRLWASRERPFPGAAEEAGAFRTVDGDDLRELCRAIAQQEAIAEQAENLSARDGTAQPARPWDTRGHAVNSGGFSSQRRVAEPGRAADERCDRR
ncbi:hypothetical protein OG320_24250 [Microbispora sp. NBC_01189]|uniref:hypothetical protein n=1 Tax=Microbispora sp. NBC_01189 TaxID=2903583 RepID=UPI002E12EA26|nr:hypothetical protein OG320_24250 [Microbispora sp. NBC_01189]